MLVELVGGLVVEALDSGFFVGAIHAFDLLVSPRVGYLVGQLVEHAPQKFGGYYPFGPWVQLGKSHFTGAVDSHAEVLVAFFGLHLGAIDVQVANRVVLRISFLAGSTRLRPAADG